LLRAVELGQLHERDDVVAELLAVALQRLGAVLARLAARDADLDQLPLGEQAHRLRRAEQAAPVEVRAADGVHLALGATGARAAARIASPASCASSGSSPHTVYSGFIPWRGAGGAGRHGLAWRGSRSGTEARRRSTCATMSLCIERYSAASSCSLASAAVSR
jgi:hypothetical protein